jgi:SAM-dependent methyltransferase
MHPDKPGHPDFDFDAVFEVEDYIYFYSDHLTEEVTEKQVDFLVKELALDEPMKILDLACGYGRHANVLAVLGHSVTGIDLKMGFLDMARQEAVRKGVKVTYRQGDMRRLDVEAKFDRVLLLYTAFGYFEDHENRLVLENVYRALKPGGLFCFDIPNRDTFLKHLLPYIVTEKNTDLMIDRITFDSATGRIHNQRVVIRDGQRRDKPFFLRLYNLSEIQILLGEVGFTVESMYGGFEAQPVSTDSRRLVIIARK